MLALGTEGLSIVEVSRMVSITRILCPVDFSDCSRRALDYAIAIGRCFGADIEVLHVTPEPFVVGRAEMQIRLDALRTEAYADAVAQTKQFVESAGISDLRVHVSVERGNPSMEIVTRAPNGGSGLIVMGTHGRSGFERMALGSVVEKVLRRVHCPMLTVPPRAVELRAETMFSRVLCPVDFSRSSAWALEFASSLTGRTKGKLVVLHAIEAVAEEPLEQRRFSVPELRQQLHEDAKERMRTTLAAEGHHPQAPEVLIVAGRAYVEILRVAADRNVDTIVMGVRGRGAIDRLMLGSTTDHVIRASTCPVLTVRRD